MDLLLGSTKKPESDNKRRATGPADADYKRLLTLVSKLTLSCAQTSRVMRAICLETVKIPTDCTFVTMAKEATTTFNTHTKGMQREERLEKFYHPHIHVWNAWLVAAKTLIKPTDQAMTQKIDAYVGRISQSPEVGDRLAKMGENVKYARVAKMYGEGFKRIEFQARQLSEEDQIWKEVMLPLMLREPKAEKLEGVPPPGDLERRIQEIIDEMEGK